MEKLLVHFKSNLFDFMKKSNWNFINYLKFGIILIAVFSLNLYSQTYPFQLNGKNFKAYHFKVQRITDTPTLNSGMPLDVMVSYIMFDSLAHSQNFDSVANYIDRIKNTDTLKMICKYFLKVGNYNPMLLKQNFFYNDTIQRFSSDPFSLRDVIYDAILSSNKFDYLDKLILTSDFIYKIKVADVYSIYDSTSYVAPTEKDITCTIEKKFKGNIVASCNSFFMNNNTLYNKKDSKNVLIYYPTNSTQNIDSGSCFQFVYRVEHQRGKISDDQIIKKYTNDSLLFNPANKEMINADDTPWVENSKEYLVFLSLGMLSRDSYFDYFTTSPFVMKSETGNIYPILNGMVKLTDELGYTNEVNSTTLFNLIETKFNYLLNFQYGQ